MQYFMNEKCMIVFDVYNFKQLLITIYRINKFIYYVEIVTN